MKALGIFRSNGLELIDIEIRDGSIHPKICPGDLRIACNDCRFSRSTDHPTGEAAVLTSLAAKKQKIVPFLLCNWYEENGGEV